MTRNHHAILLGLCAAILARFPSVLVAQVGSAAGQNKADSTQTPKNKLNAPPRQLAPVIVAASLPLHVIGHLPTVRDGVIYSGKKTEMIVMDSLIANVSQDVERQILGRIPGANFSETQGAGFPSNGIGFRGLDPTQSVEVNTRQNGVNLAADLYGYPETYYTPPSEALERIEVVRGAASLAFGPQFGGVINYASVLPRAPAIPASVLTTPAGVILRIVLLLLSAT